MKCGVGLCGHCQLGPAAGVPRRPGRRLRPGRTPARRPGAVMTSTDSQPADPRRLEVRVLRRLPADPARLRGRAAGAGRPGPDRALPRGVQRGRCPGPYDLSLVEGSITTAARRGAHPRRSGEQSRFAGHHRRLRDRRRHPGAAQLRRRRPSSARRSTPARSTSTRWPRPRRSSAHVPVDFELRGCPIDKGQLLELITAFLAGPQAGHPGRQRVHRVQAPRADLRHGRATARRAWARSPTPAAARCARPCGAAATAASAR